MQGIGKYPASGSSPALANKESDSRPFFSFARPVAHAGILVVSSLIAVFLVFRPHDGAMRLQSELLAFVTAEMAAHPDAEIGDVYKLLYQGSFGVGHIIRSRNAAMAFLVEEIGDLGAPDSEPLLSACSVDGSMLRVNLRAFVRDSLDASLLVDAMIATVRLHRPDTATFLREWKEIGSAIEHNALPFTRQRYREITDSLCSAEYPAVHHSAAYAAAYRPAYRVLLRSAFESVFDPKRTAGILATK